MRYRLCRTASVVLAAFLLLTSPARAASYSTDQSDLWYIASESGWGMQLVQRGNTIFATLFVYAANGTPTWYVATMVPTGGQFQWSGTLYATTGPWFGTIPFNPANDTVVQVGTMTWTAETVTTGNVSYTVNGVAVNKFVVRQTLVFDDFSGHYFGGVHIDETNCSNPANNGNVEGAAILEVTQSGTAVSVSFTGAYGNCSFPGKLTQFGQMGDVQGSFVCGDGSAGTFHLYETQVNVSGITSRFSLAFTNPPSCMATGWLGGMRANSI